MVVKTLAEIHSATALLFAKHRLKVAGDNLEKEYRTLWDYPLPMRGGDTLRFFPYTIRLGETNVQYEKGQVIKSWGPPKVTDPVNVIVYGVSRNEFLKLLKRSNPKWEEMLGTCQFLHGSGKWYASTPLKIDVDKRAGERQHMRLFEARTRKGISVVLCAAHRDGPKDKQGKHPAPKSFNEPRNIMMQDLVNINLQTYFLGPITEKNFRGVESDGKILFMARE